MIYVELSLSSLSGKDDGGEEEKIFFGKRAAKSQKAALAQSEPSMKRKSESHVEGLQSSGTLKLRALLALTFIDFSRLAFSATTPESFYIERGGE